MADCFGLASKLGEDRAGLVRPALGGETSGGRYRLSKKVNFQRERTERTEGSARRF